MKSEPSRIASPVVRQLLESVGKKENAARKLDAALWHDSRVLLGLLGKETPLDRAQAKAYEALADPARAKDLAREALALSSDCVDAYAILAEHVPNLSLAIDLYDKALAAGKRLLAPDLFQQDPGRLWDVLLGRSYLVALVGVAQVLWKDGRSDEAIARLNEAIRLDAKDTIGARDLLIWLLVLQARQDEASALLARFPNDISSFWNYSKALLAFQRQGDCPESRQLLSRAVASNKCLIAILQGRDPFRPPHRTDAREAEDALFWLATLSPLYKSIPGAINWLRANDPNRPPLPAPPICKGPLAAVKSWLVKRLPQSAEVWEADARMPKIWWTHEGQRVRAWSITVVSASRPKVLIATLEHHKPSPALLWDLLVDAMKSPRGGPAERPATLCVLPGEDWAILRPHLEEIGVSLRTLDKLDLVDQLTAVGSALWHDEEPNLYGGADVRPEHVARLFEAAADYFERAPWRNVGASRAIKLDSQQYPGGPRYAIVKGWTGQLRGLGVVDTFEDLAQFWRSPYRETQDFRTARGAHLGFGDETALTVSDLDLVAQHGWKVAQMDAYPRAFRADADKKFTALSLADLGLLEACLRTVPDFVARRGQRDQGAEEMTAATAVGEVRLTLSWVHDNS